MAKPVAEFTEFTNASQWVSGTVGGFEFSAKLFDDGSRYGIKNGRVSKLSIWPLGGSWANNICNYDRGWDTRVAPKHRKYYNAVMRLLENAPKRFEN